MRSVEHRFKLFQTASPGHSSFIVFGRTIKGQNFTRRIIAVHFRKLVEKSDYAPRDKNRLLAHMEELTKDLEDSISGGQNCVRTHEATRPKPLSPICLKRQKDPGLLRVLMPV